MGHETEHRFLVLTAVAPPTVVHGEPGIVAVAVEDQGEVDLIAVFVSAAGFDGGDRHGVQPKHGRSAKVPVHAETTRQRGA